MKAKNNISGIFSTDIVVLNDEEREIITNFFDLASTVNDASILKIEKKLMDLERLSTAISHFPSIKEQSFLAGEKRTEKTLIENLCKTHPDSRMLSMPTKAILGRGFLVAKFHTFLALTKIATQYLKDEFEVEKLRDVTLNIMFTIMSEDVYISILDSSLFQINTKEKIAEALVYLWEHRLDRNTPEFAPVLTKIWSARDKIAPVFGTMMGTSELFLLSSKLGETWYKFTNEKICNKHIGQSLEEFLFGLSYEDISFVKKELRIIGKTAMSKDEVASLLNKKIDSTNEPKSFYTSYVTRRNNANARKRLNVDGPKNTLEDFYISFLFENKLELKDNVKRKKSISSDALSSVF